MDDNTQRNTMFAVAISIAILIGWQVLYGIPQADKARQQLEAEQAAQQVEQQAQPVPAPAGGSTAPIPGGSVAPTTATAPGLQSRDIALANSPRIGIDTPRVRGSIALKGGRVDDIVLKDYRETVKPNSPNIVVLNPTGTENAYYAEFGWVGGAGTEVKLPAPDTVWSVEGNAELTPQNPVTLVYDNGEGLAFRRTYAIDTNYMISVRQDVQNGSTQAVTLYPYGLISRRGTPQISGFFILHEGLIGMMGEQGLQEIDYSDLVDDGPVNFTATGGWLGITDKYWAAVLIPDQAAKYQARMSATMRGTTPVYQSDYLLDGQVIAPGASGTMSSRLFAGAKETNVIDVYQQQQNVENFELLIDWGWFYFITKPLFYVIDYLFRLFGNFGVAILAVTVLVKLFFFPLANKSYVSMSKMKKLQPEVQKLRERYADDKMKQQQAMMEIYKKEKINPMSGCLPILLQIPVFFALYKVLFVTIEMRHAPFFGWIQDLAAPDPTTIFNLFGLIPWDPPQFLMLGVWPLIMGITMFIQMRLNPPPPDPVQAQIFNWMPVIFTFLLASFPAGLVIYWAWNNTLSIIQQYVIMRRQGVKVELWDNIKGLFGKKAAAKESE